MSTEKSCHASFYPRINRNINASLSFGKLCCLLVKEVHNISLCGCYQCYCSRFHMRFKEQENKYVATKIPKPVFRSWISVNRRMGSSLNLVGWSCAVLRGNTSVCCLWLGQNSFKWTLSTTRIFQKCIETVHPGKCDFTASKTLDMVIKRLNICCLFCWQQWFFLNYFFIFIELLKLSRMKPLQDF